MYPLLLFVLQYIARSVAGEGIENSYTPELCPGCDCGDTCDDPTKCGCCRDMGGQFPYDAAGRLQLEVGMPVFECNPSCKCNASCVNRVVQNG